MGGIITLTTDFGTADGYVGAMKGVILGINPAARLVDICHAIPPQNIAQAAFALGTAYEFFPQDTVHLAVVDPGVGTNRKAVVLKTPPAVFVAPDNGVLGYIIGKYASGKADGNRQALDTSQAQAYEITNAKYWRPAVNPTFHGRDIFAPVAAHLSLGVPTAAFGPPLDSLVILPLGRSQRQPDGTLTGSVIHIDRFGNLITGFRRADLPDSADDISIEVNGKLISGLAETYAESEGLLALIGSSDYLEIALKDGSAAAFTGANVGDKVSIKT